MHSQAGTLQSLRNRSWFWPKVLFVCGLHVAFWLQAVLNQSSLTDDSIQYLLLAENWVDEGIFSQSYFAPFVEDVQRTPGYPIFLIALGRWIPLILAVQHGLVLLSGWWIYRGMAALGQETAGRWAGWIFVLMPYQIVFASLILSETLFVFLLIVASVESVVAIKEARWGGMVFAGMAWGMAIMVRPVAWPMFLVMLVLAGGWLLLRKKKAAAMGLLLLTGMILPLGWMARNHALTGQYSLSTMGGMGMIHGRLGGLEADRQGLGVHEHALYMCGDSIAALEIGFPALRVYPPQIQTHETERFDPRVSRITTSYFLAHPWDAHVFQAKRVIAMLGGVGQGWAAKVSQSQFVGWLMASLQALINLFLYLGVLMAIWQWRKLRFEDWMMLVLVAVALFVSAAAWSDGRYRMVIDGLLLMVACRVWKEAFKKVVVR